jgi:hypothetical protein
MHMRSGDAIQMIRSSDPPGPTIFLKQGEYYISDDGPALVRPWSGPSWDHA